MTADDIKGLEFSTLAGALPPSRARFALTGKRTDVTLPSSGAHEFVAPRLAAYGIDQPLATFQAIVISAAGAVGKSTLAREIAGNRGWPLWNLATSGSVGEGSLQGMIAHAFGIATVSEVNAALSAGGYGLVVDALDEGRIRINEAGFEDFMKEVGTLASQLPGPGLILLGRTQIARRARWYLEDAGARVALLEISHFDEHQRVEYVDKKIQRLSAKASQNAKAHAKPFAQVRDKIFDLLSHAVTGGSSDGPSLSQAESFLGYAPVLDAVAVLLANAGNFAELLQEVDELDAQTSGAKSGPVAILRRVVETIMRREQREKLVPNMKDAIEGVALKHNWDQWDQFYSIDEQSARLLGKYLQTTPTIRWAAPIPAEIVSEYEEHLQTWLSEHPFLRDGGEVGNAVFESFLIAQALVNDAGGTRKLVEERLRQARYKPNPLMAEFYLDLASNGRTIRAEHVGFLYDSLLSGLRESWRIRFAFTGGDVTEDRLEDSADVEFEFVDEDDALIRSIDEQVQVDVTSQLIFTRYLKDADIDTGIDVVLGGGSTEYEIGPRVAIDCGLLHLDAESLVITGSRSGVEPEDFGVVLGARECRSKVSAQPRVRTQLQVSWPGAEAYPWVKYSSPRLADAGTDVGDAYRRFRRIVLTLRSHKKGSLARLQDKVESDRVLGHGIGPRVLERLVKDGLLRLDGRFYHWVPERADALVGVSWLQLRRSETSDKLLVYLRSI